MLAQQSASVLHVSPYSRHRSGGGGAQTRAPIVSTRHSPPQHSLPTLHEDPSVRQGRGAQYAEMFAECGFCPGSQYAAARPVSLQS